MTVFLRLWRVVWLSSVPKVLSIRVSWSHDIDSMMVQLNCGGVCTITDMQKPRRKVWVTRSTYVVFERQVVKVVPKT